MSDAGRPVEDRLAVLEEEQRDAKRILLEITERQEGVRRLASATDGLTASTDRVEQALTRVDEAWVESRAARSTADDANTKADDTATKMVLSESRYRRRTRLYALGAILISLTAVVLVAVYARSTRNRFQDFQNTAYQRCQTRLQIDTANHLSVGADVNLLRSQIQQAKDSRAATRTLILSFPPDQQAALRAEVKAAHKALQTALTAKEKAYAEGVIGSCQTLKK